MLVPEIIDNGALLSLNLSNNSMGQLVSQSGWCTPGNSGWTYSHPNGSNQYSKPSGEEFKAMGVIALATAIKDMGAISYEVITRESLVAFYTEHNPDCLGNVDEILQEYSVPELKDSMQIKYGSIPDVTVIPKTKGALSVLSLKNNRLCNSEAGKALSEMLAVNTVLKKRP
jgi:hypothetical protein